MANKKNLGASGVEVLDDDGISAIPIGGATPPSAEMPLAIPPKFPLDLQAQLQAAADSGRYMIAVWTADEESTITLFRSTAGSFLYDWWLRALSMLRDQIVNASPPGPAAPPAMTDDSPQNNPAADE